LFIYFSLNTIFTHPILLVETIGDPQNPCHSRHLKNLPPILGGVPSLSNSLSQPSHTLVSATILVSSLLGSNLLWSNSQGHPSTSSPSQGGGGHKWYVDEKSGSHVTFESLAKAFFSFFQLPVCHDIRLEILSEFKQTTVIHITNHIHEWHRRHSLCKAETTKEKRLDWFLKSLVSVISKDVASTFPQSEEEAIKKDQQFDLIYAQSGYLYTVFPDAPRPIPFGQDKPGMSHAADGLIGSMNHLNPYGHPSPTYGAHPYPQPYGGHLITLLPLTNIHIHPLHQWWTPTSTHDAFGLSTKYEFTLNPHILPQQ
jgi:hypothetical protein